MDINEQIRENLGLVYAILNKFNLRDDPDAESIAYEYLYKALLTFNASMNTSLSTYATCLISNALRGHLRSLNKKRQIRYISLYTPISNEEPDLGYLLDIVKSNESTEDTVYAGLLKGKITEAISKILSEITSNRQRAIILLWLESSCTLVQKDLAAAAGVTQASVSQALSAFKHRLSQELEDYL